MADLSRLGRLPMFMCGFRPFFLATAASAMAALAAWLGFLSGFPTLPAAAGGALAWHAHEMLYGFAFASVAGFLLTAIPEFTGSAPIGRDRLAGMTLLWLAARIAYWNSGWMSIWPAALLGLALGLALLAAVAPAVWREPGRPQLGFVHGLAALAMLEAGFFAALVRGADGLPWLYGANEVLMVLIVMAVSRISMRVVNGGVDGDGEDAGYRARPPRRNLAVCMIALHGLAEFFLGDQAASGWVALAAGAAVFNLLNDWHIGRPLFRRWPLMLYGVYWMMAAGYGAMGVARLSGVLPVSAGRHLLMAGAMSLAILTVMCIAGRNHSGRDSDRRPWVVLAAAGLAMAALGRLLAGTAWLPPGANLLLWSGWAWIACYALYLAYSARMLAAGRADGRGGCAGPAD